MSIQEVAININQKTKTVPLAAEKPKKLQIETLVTQIVTKMKLGADFYIGAGTSGRLELWMHQECPPTLVSL
jgi:N-acetylmuramic acid 6-phosphate (MurNAc-6-P) etherase